MQSEPYLLGGGIKQESPLGNLYMNEMNLWSDAVPDELFHYTSSTGLDGILSKKVLWATHAGHLNDLTELGYAREFIVEMLEKVRTGSSHCLLDKLKEQNYSDLFVLRDDGVVPFITSFCEDRDLLSQWRGYANSGQGFAIGFDLTSFHTSPPGFSFLRKVEYDPTDQRTRLGDLIEKWHSISCDGLERDKSDPLYVDWFRATWALKNILIDYHIGLKHPSFREEKEWRIVRYVDVNNLRVIARDQRDQIRDSVRDAQSNGEGPEELAQLAEYSNNAVSMQSIRFRSSSQGLVPYIEQDVRGTSGEYAFRFPVTSIVVGPTPFSARQRDSVELLTSLRHDLGPVRVERSQIPLV